MLAKLEQSLSHRNAERAADHLLVVLPKATTVPAVPGAAALKTLLARRRMKSQDLADKPLCGNLADGRLAAWVMVDFAKPVFEQQTVLRKALQPLLDEQPRNLAVAVFGDQAQRRRAAGLGVHGAWVNGALLPVRKKKDERKPLGKILLFGFRSPDGFAALRARAEGNLLARELTILPPNELTPGLYRERVRKLARQEGWKHREYDLKTLRRMGAGAFVAVARGSIEEDAAIVHLRRQVKGAGKTIALVGKGICFDTGGHNLKPARYMHGMHEDMNGSAVALGILLAATRSGAPVNLDCWLALAQNHISPKAYKQNEVVRALNGTTIEVVHTDAEGRMVLADTLTLAARGKPSAMVDFATLTGSMHAALGSRYSGIFATDDELIGKAIAAGRATGERVCAFPFDADYDPALDSKIADIKQCTMEGEADHILAARFLNRFVSDIPWLHMDLSASSCSGGLGAVASDVTGFGVAWGMAFLESLAQPREP
ncbi:MAG: leucyl aminopeptidase family protein [Betaproteobacteria bacterium]|nr:leucyl aminopeptidase family protein [Betaproteobacteria bacterium]